MGSRPDVKRLLNTTLFLGEKNLKYSLSLSVSAATHNPIIGLDSQNETNFLFWSQVTLAEGFYVYVNTKTKVFSFCGINDNVN
jgi:hypothetical protein